MKTIDFRSDTVTQPSPEMRRAMAESEVGDDVFGDDPTVNLLEATGARKLGKEAALFASSGTQTNLLALLTHCARGDEYLVGQDAHTYKYEGGGGAVFGAIQPQPIEFEPDGTLDLDKVAAKIKPDDFHHPRTRLLCLENTTGNKVLPLPYQARAAEFARSRGLAIHLDGARIYNAAVRDGVDVQEIAVHYDTVSVCLSKGLGAPVGSLLCGPAEFIGRARRWRKVLGGGMRQAGVLAAAGLYALEHNVARLRDDHDNAAYLAVALRAVRHLEVLPRSGETNMVFVKINVPKPADRAVALAAFLRDRGVLISDRHPLRLVTHLDVDRDACVRLVEGVRAFMEEAK
ncbi:low-specificity L-threonine aldolase [Myxococcota bacterium]|nr:low-specificity L-threonine aldolase [Myxococcota bacterium]